MSAGLQRLSGPSSAFHSGSGPPSAPSSSASTLFSSGGTGQAVAHQASPHFVRESTPQTMGTAGGLPVAPQLAHATGHAQVAPISGPSVASPGLPQSPAPYLENRSVGGVPIQHRTAEEFPAQEELKVEGSANSAPQAPTIGQIRHGRLDMSNDASLEALPASAVAAGLTGPSINQEVMRNVDMGVVHSSAESHGLQQAAPTGHHHAYEKPGVVLPRSANDAA